MAIATIDDVKLRIGLTSSQNDVFLQQLLDSVTLNVERLTGLRFDASPPFDISGNDTASPVTVSVPAPAAASDGTVVVKIPHARQITAVTLNRGASTLAPITVDPPPLGGYWTETDSRFYTPLIRRVGIIPNTRQAVYDVQVTGRFGVVPAPVDIVDAVLRMVARSFHEKDAAYSDAVQLPDGAVANYFRQFPPAVRAVVDSYCELGV